MQTWRPWHLRDGGIGLNTQQREDQIAPNAFSVCKNIDASDVSLRKRRGFRRVLKGSLDAVSRGGAPGESLYFWGDERKRLDPRRTFAPSAGTGFSTPRYVYRTGVGVMPEFDLSNIRLDVQAGDNRWAIEVCVYADELYCGPEDSAAKTGIAAYSRTKPNLPVVIASKSDGKTFQWKVIAKPDATEDLNVRGPYVCLRMRDVTTTTEYDFYYQSGGVPASFIERGRRYWFAWEYDGTNITSYYWKEGDAAAVSYAQAPVAAFKANGVGTATYPVIFGGMSVPSPANQYPGSDTERNFNGFIPEFRFWDSGSTSAVTHPDWTNPATNWYFEREIPGESINANGTWADSSLAQCSLYLQMTPTRIDTADGRMLLPRAGVASGGIDFSKNKVWLTGADACWAAANDGTTAKALLFCPVASAGQEDAYYRAPNPATTSIRHLFGGGIRVPGAIRYWRRQTSSTAVSQGYRAEFHDGFSVQVRFRADGLESGFADMTLVDHREASGGTVSTLIPWKLLLTWSGGSAKLQAKFDMTRTGGGAPVGSPITGTTALVAGTWYTATLCFQYIQRATDFSARVSLYLGSTLEGSYDPNSIPDTVKKPYAPQDGVTGSGGVADTSLPNANDKQGGEVAFMTIGVSCETLVVATEGTVASQSGGYPAGVSTVNWGYHDNRCPLRENDGCVQRNNGLFRGAIGRVAIFARELSRQDVSRWSTRAPTRAEIAIEGNALLSLWDMQEGSGNVLFDRGSLGNHIRFNPYPRVRSGAGPIYRRSKAVIDGLWEFRTRTPREGTVGRELYALAGGSVMRAAKDGSGELYLEPMAHRILSRTKPQPTAFQFSDFAYICTGEGPVLRVSRGRVNEAGLSPVTGDIQGFDLGWIEAVGNGTFWVTDQLGTSTVATTPFQGTVTYQYLITYWDADAAIESAPSRIRAITIEKAPDLTHAVDYLRLSAFPIPRDPHVTHYRIYRTAGDGDVFRFVDQIPVTALHYDDRKTDDDLEHNFAATTNYPPPLNARIGIATGTRAFYAGVPEQPGTFWWSKAGYPEVVPASYQATVTAGRSGRITGFLWLQDRTMIFLQDGALVAFDTGGDVGLGSLEQPPIQVGVVAEGIGCVEHNTIVHIPDVGGVFAGEKGVYVTDGSRFVCVSDAIQPTYDALDKSSYQSWHAIHLRSHGLYVLFCRSSDATVCKDVTAGRNNFALVWDYAAKTWSVWADIPAKWSRVIEDETTGMNRVYFGDYMGEVFEFDPQDVTISNDGVGTEMVTAKLTGTVVSATSASLVRLFSSNEMPTSGDGLRGVLVQFNTGASGALEYRRITYNDGQYVYLDAALSATPTSANTFALGAIASEARGGMWDLGEPSAVKRVGAVELNLGAGGEGAVRVELRFSGEALGVAENVWLVDSTADRFRAGPKVGRGERMQLRIYDDAPNNHWETTDIEVGFWMGRRIRWRG